MNLVMLIIEVIGRAVGIVCLVLYLIASTRDGATVESLHLLVLGVALCLAPGITTRGGK